MVLFWTLHLSLAPFASTVKPDYWPYIIVSGSESRLLAQAFDTQDRASWLDQEKEFSDFLKSWDL